MNIIENYVFKTNVSVDTYETKDEARACLSKPGADSIGKNKMSFKEQNVSVSEFLDLATTGHAFCNLFDFNPDDKYWIETSDGKHYQSYPIYKKGSNKGGMKLTFKSEEYFKGAQTVFVDIDFTRYQNISEYLATLTYKPTCVYMSFSDNKEKKGVVSRRFRLVYVLDRIIDKNEFIHIAQSINDQIVMDTAEPMDDDCGTRACQYMNGVYGNLEVYQTNCIYSVDDFYNSDTTEAFETTSAYDFTGQETEDQSPQPLFDENLLRDMGTLSYTDFMHYYSTQFPYLYRTERTEWIANTYQMTDENYLQLWFYRERVVDGQWRRRKLFKNACLRRLISPDIDPNTLLFNLYVDFCRFFDNSDGVITLETLKRKVISAMEMTQDQLLAFCDYEIRYCRENRPKFICKPGTKTNRGMISRIAKHIRWNELDRIYDRDKSIQENLENIDIPLSTLYRYCKEKFIDTDPNRAMTKEMSRNKKRLDKKNKIEQFQDLYDPKLSVRKNQEIMEESGLKLSIGTIVAWVGKYCTPELTYGNSNNIFSFQVPDFDLNPDSYLADYYKIPVSDWDIQEEVESEEKQNDPFSNFHPWGTLELNWNGF